MRAVVTGGAGFIGSNLVDALLAGGHRVEVIDDLSTGRRENLSGALRSGGVLHELDITDGAAVAECLLRLRPQVVFHLAAQIDVRRSVREPGLDAQVNVEGTINVLEAARQCDVDRVVFSSTGGAIYGETDVLPSPETVQPLPEAPYGQSKFCAERYCGLFSRLYGLSTVALRYGNVYGPRQDPLGEAGVVAIFCGKLLCGEAATVYGDGSQTRDYVHVADVVAANLAAAQRREVSGEVNVGTGRETSVLELVRTLRELNGDGGFEVEHAPARSGEVARSCLDVTRARERLDWRAQTAMHDGLRQTLAATREAAAARA